MAVNNNFDALRVGIDPVLTTVVHGYAQAMLFAPFAAPPVTVMARAGTIVEFTTEAFAIKETRRAPGGLISSSETTYGFEKFTLVQHAHSGIVTAEAAEEALNGPASVDLEEKAALQAAEAISQSWELEAVGTVADPLRYELNNRETLAGTARFDDASSDPEVTVLDWRERVRRQVGLYPNSAGMSTEIANALITNPLYRDRVKFTSAASVNLTMLATWFNLPRGIRVAQRLKLNVETGSLEDIWPADTMIVFYSPDGEVNEGFVPLDDAANGTPSFAYTYSLQGYPTTNERRFDADRRRYLYDVIAEQQVVMTGMGETGLVGAGFIADGVVTVS